MFYQLKKNDHGLAYDPFKSCVVPRPIGWISTLSLDGVPNLAPYSQFQILTFDPPYVMFAANQKTDGSRKDSVVNAEQSKEFVYNMATYDLREAVNISAQEVPPDVDEFELAGVGKTPSNLVKPYRVKESPAQYECRYHQTLRLRGNGVIGTVDVVIGEVLAVHIKDEFIMPDGKLDVIRMKPVGRLGYYDYTCVESLFEMAIPGSNEELRAGMEGKAVENSENN
ncbi:MAG: flavin reductase family protein [Desulfobacterales bacterium]|jgi:flavin reductase (DIM6/NTAB) family NADH-FMN oxidoreductase RutF